ncbi:MAG: phage holin family protein [Bacillales bacterium]|jgi:putative membrane protein|nr:phage holin family protein [Bacillales bacterium]
MKKWIIKLLLIGLLFVGLTEMTSIFEGFKVESYQAAVIAALVISILNVTVRPLMKMFAFPLTLITFGLFALVINAVTLLIADNIMGTSLELGGFFNAFLLSIILSLANSILDSVMKK